ncbi:MAG: class I SAM-dependent methyltransferase [Candidatus Zixiibacteriota bacterium]
MQDKQGIKDLFREDMKADFDFTQAPQLITPRGTETTGHKAIKTEDLSQWSKAQRSFLNWVKDKKVFTKEYIEGGKVAYDAFFKKRGSLRGNILDIGGGWGLYRQWWIPCASSVFIVHDPGVERFLGGPHELHLFYYQRAFSLPMSFIEGFGEDLPYKDSSFDTCLIAATLDHCMNPEKVLEEAYRCLKPGGVILVIQYCPSLSTKDRQSSILKRLLKILLRPKHFLAVLHNSLFHPDHHIHHFGSLEITSLLKRARFSKVGTSTLPTLHNVCIFEAVKEYVNGT